MTTTDKHQKHAFVPKPKMGNYCSYEWGILGAPCSRIEWLVDQIANHLGFRHIRPKGRHPKRRGQTGVKER